MVTPRQQPEAAAPSNGELSRDPRLIQTQQRTNSLARDIESVSKLLPSDALHSYRELCEKLQNDPAALSAALQSIQKLARQDLVDGLKLLPGARADLIRNAIREAARPEELNLGDHAACSATAVLFKLASENPAEYLRLIAGLVTDGKVKLLGGSTLRINETALAPDKPVKNPGVYQARTISERILQASLTDLGNGDLKYDNRTDLNSRGLKAAAGGDVGTYSGLFDFQLVNLMMQVSGSGARACYNTAENREQLMGSLRSQKGNAPISLFWDREGAHSVHVVNFLGFGRLDSNGKLIMDKNGDIAVYRNTFGRRSVTDLTGEVGPTTRVVIDKDRGIEGMSRDEFQQRLRMVLVRDSSVRKPMTVMEDMELTKNLQRGDVLRAPKSAAGPDVAFVPNGFDVSSFILMEMMSERKREEASKGAKNVAAAADAVNLNDGIEAVAIDLKPSVQQALRKGSFAGVMSKRK